MGAHTPMYSFAFANPAHRVSFFFNMSASKELTNKQRVNAPQNLTSCNFSSLYIFCLGQDTISWRFARLLIVLHPKRDIESELKWQTC